MANLTKPAIKMLWRGQKGNKFRVWEIITLDGNRHVRVNKETAHRQYKANVKMYNKLKRKGY